MNELEVDARLKTARYFLNAYVGIGQQRTKTLQNSQLMALSLRLPPSFLLSRFELSLDSTDIRSSATTKIFVPRHSLPYGLHSLLRLEAMHNLDLGVTADLLRAIENYFSASLSAAEASKVVSISNKHQNCLPRCSASGMFRLPSQGTTIAQSHANVNAIQYKSALCVLPFMLNGSYAKLRNAAATFHMYKLLNFVLAYLKLHHHVRRINMVPYYIYENLDEEVGELVKTFYEKYKSSLGMTTNAEGVALGTMKAHQMYNHLLRDMKSGGLVSNYDAQSGESHHVQTRAHYQLSSRRGDAEENVALRSATRELGVLAAMYPVRRDDL